MPDLLPKTMQDRGAFWTPVPDWTSAVLEGDGWSARAVPHLHRLLVSGDLETALRTLAPDTFSIGLWQIADGDIHASRIGRDRMLITSAMPLGAPFGWNPGGFAVSLADDAYLTLDVAGPKLRDLVAEMTFTKPDDNSPSAATLVCGQQALLHRTDETTARIHVETSLAPYLWHWLERR